MTPVQTKAPRSIRLFLSFTASLVVALAVAAMLPVAARAADNVAYVRNSEGECSYYTSITEAVSAAYGKDKTLVMLTDWGLYETLEIADSKELTIDMNGHRIKAIKGVSVITMREHSTLTLMSSKPNTTFEYKGFPKAGGSKKTMTLSSGGLITDGRDYDGGGFLMEADSHLTLNGVAVAGNCGWTDHYRSGHGGGIYAKGKCTIDLKNKATIQNNNSANWGGGIYLEQASDPTTINLDASEIKDNYAGCSGGGVYSASNGTHISLTNGAGINGNVAESAGGGIYLHHAEFSVESSDGNGWVSGNVCKASDITNNDGTQNGGGIHVASHSAGSGGTIKGLKIVQNRSARDGGGLELDQERTRLIDCTIELNRAGMDGGGIFVNNDYISIEGCNIRENVCNTDGENYEGGGVFVSYHYDVEMKGKCEVINNTRGADTNNYDDVFLSTLSGKTAFAYITGGVSKGSKIGVRTGITEDRRIGKNINNADKASFFIDLDGYYVSYGTDEGGDMWQRHRTREFTVTVDGKQVGSYAQGMTVFVSASPDSSRVFKCWDADRSTARIFDDSNKTIDGLAFTMPQNDVELVADYVTRIQELKLAVDAPVAGSELPTTGVLVDGEQKLISEEAPVTWLEVTDSGNVPASGTAKYGTSYVAVLSLEQDLDYDMAYALDIEASKQRIRIGESDQAVASASVDATGRLTMTSQPYETAKPSVVDVSSPEVTVAAGASQADLLNVLPIVLSARTDAGTTVRLNAQASKADLSGLVVDGEVVAPEGGTTTLSIPVTSDEVQLPDGQSMVQVAVTVVSGETPQKLEAPALTLVAGTYDATDSSQSTHFDENGNLIVGVSCDDTDATLRYAVWKYDAAAGTWHVQNEGTDGALLGASREILLPAADGALATYEVEVWATPSAADGAETASLLGSANGTATVESDHVRGTYTVDAVTKHSVTVNYANTAVGDKPDPKDPDTYSVADNGSLTVTAPEREGYVFEKWQAADGSATLGTSTSYTFANVTGNVEVTAVYNPVVSAFDVSFAEPVAHQKLAATATIKAKVAGSEEYFDATSFFEGSDGKAALSWSPSANADGKAEHMTNYTVALKVKSDVESTSDAKYVIDPDAEVTYNQAKIVEAGGAYVSKASDDGSLFLCINCENTGPVEWPVFDSLSDVELSYEQALAYQAGQDEGYDETWGLPKGVLVTSKKCGCSVFLDITWGKVTGFDKNVLGAQQFTATGKVSFPAYIDNQDEDAKIISDEVSVTVKVAAANTVAAPVASVKAGTYASAQTVELSCETEEATIRYTTDGTEPTASSPKYGGPIVVPETTTIKARAFCDGLTPSEVATFEYKIEADSSQDPDDEDDEQKGGSDEQKGGSDGREDGSGKGKALPQTGDAGYAAGMVAAALAGVGALGLSWCLRRRNG